MGKRNKPGFWKRMQARYKLSFFNENTLEEVWTLHLSRVGAVIVAVIVVAFIVVLVLSFVLGTPARTLLPGYLRTEDRLQMVDNTLRIDSLMDEMQIRDYYLANIRAILSGEITVDSLLPQNDTTRVWQPGILTKSSQASEAFADAYEQEERFMLNTLPKPDEGLVFYPPVKGIITQHYDAGKTSYGIGIQVPRRAAASAVLDGTVVSVTYTIENGYVIIIQHNYKYMSIYRNNMEALRKVGDVVAAGEKIAIIGLPGDNSNDIVAEFELWHAGVSLDPEMHIVF